MNDLVFRPVVPMPGSDRKLQYQMESVVEKALDQLLESQWFVDLVDDRVRMVIEIMNEEAADAETE